MTAALGAPAAAILLLVAASAEAQEPAGSNPATGAVATQPVRDTRPTTGAEPPKVDPKLLIDVINLLTRPRPSPPPGTTAPAPAPSEPAATPSPPATEPKSAAVAVAPAPKIPPSVVVPRAVSAAPAPPRPAPSSAAAPPPVAADEPLPVEVAPPASPPVVTVNVQPASPEPPEPEPVLEPTNAFPGTAGWLLFGLIAAAAVIAAASAGVRRARRLARTKAALSLEPRLDMPAGSGSAKGPALAGPAVAIRTRLDWIGAQ